MARLPDARDAVGSVSDMPVGADRGRGESVWAPPRRAMTLGLVLTVTLVAFEALSVATILPRVARDLGGVGLYGWAFSAFFLGNLVGIVQAGRRADEHGLVRPFVLGLVLFGAGLLVGGLAPTMPVLVAGRLIQGFGAGAIPPVAYVAIGREYPASVRPRMFAILSTAWVVPGLVGPAIAGLVADQFTWRLVFLGLIPFIAASGALSVPSLPRISASDRPTLARGPGLLPAVRTAAGAGLVLAALSSASVVPTVVLGVAGLAIGLPALATLIPEGTLRAARGLPATVLARGVLTFGFFGAEAFLPLTLVSVRGTTATIAGLALTAATLSWTAGAWVQAHLTTSWGTSRLIRLGFGIVSAGVAGIATVLVPEVPLAAAVGAWAIAGLGMGLAYASISLAVLHTAPRGREGAATSGMQLADVLGTALGTGSCGAIVAIGVAAGWSQRTSLFLAFGLAVAATLGGLAVTRRLADPTRPARLYAQR
jgi:MFS family permease